MRIIRRLIVLLLGLVAIVYFAENRAVVEFVWAPEIAFLPEPFASGRSVSMPLFLVVFSSLCLGLLLASAGLLSDSAGSRMTVRRQKKQIGKLEKELDAARGEAAELVAKTDEGAQRALQAENAEREATRRAADAERRAEEAGALLPAPEESGDAAASDTEGDNGEEAAPKE